MANTHSIYRNGKLHVEGIEGNSYTDTDVDPSTDYEYQVSAVNENGESELSETVAVKTEPEEPGDEEEGTEEQSLESLTVNQLKEQADEQGVEYPSNVRKTNLIDLIKDK